jgi:plastocyanin
MLRGTGSLLALATAGCMGSSGGTDSKQQSVGMTEDYTFDPKTVRIPVGTTVVWKNTSKVAHTVTAYEDMIPKDAAYFASGGFKSERAARKNVNAGLIGPDEQYEHTFEQAARYRYFCIPHESLGMVGTVQVQQ